MSAQLRWQIAFLKVARSGYVAVVMVLPAMLALLAIAAVVARRWRVRAPWVARALALGLALAFGMSVAESVSAARLAAMRMPFPRLTTDFPDPPGDRTVDVVVLGESSAAGVPYQDWLSVGDIVTWKLGEALPDREFPVSNLARPGLKLDEMHMLLQTLEPRPDLVIPYAGHNEFAMRYNWAHGAPYYADEITSTRVTLAGLVGAYSRVCWMIDETTGLLLQASPSGGPSPVAWWTSRSTRRPRTRNGSAISASGWRR
jgi:hypothetical protein